MVAYFIYIVLLFFNNIFSFLIISIEILDADECIKSIDLDNYNLYTREDDDCDWGTPEKIKNIEKKIIPYEFGQIL